MAKAKLSKEEIYDYYVNQKMPAYVISERFKIGQATISRKLKEMGVKLRAPKKTLSLASNVIPRDEFISLINEGVKYKEISERYKVCINSISLFAKQLGISRYTGLTIEQMNKMRELRNMGKTYREIADELNVNIHSMSYYIDIIEQ